MSRSHRLFAVACLLAGVALLALVLLVAVGTAGFVADAYFALTTAVLPAAWRDEWRALPSIVHVGVVVTVAAVVVGAASELLDD